MKSLKEESPESAVLDHYAGRRAGWSRAGARADRNFIFSHFSYYSHRCTLCQFVFRCALASSPTKLSIVVARAKGGVRMQGRVPQPFQLVGRSGATHTTIM